MNDDLGVLASFLGNPGEPVAEVEPDDLKAFWQETRKHQTKYPSQQISFTAKAIAKTRANGPAVWYRSSMIWVLNRVAQEQLSPWIEAEEISDAVFRTMAMIPMEWIGQTEREGLPFDVEEFFHRLREDVQNG